MTIKVLMIPTLAVIALVAFIGAIWEIVVNHRHIEARRAEQREWNRFFEQLEDREAARANHAVRWED